MKRATTMLRALALAIAGFLFAASSANATHPTPPVPAAPLGCSLVASGSAWPTKENYYYCGSNPSTHRGPVGSTLATTPPHLRTKHETTNTWLFVWDDISELQSYRAANGGTPLPNPFPTYRTYGFTSVWTVGGQTFITINVFEDVDGHNTCTPGTYCQVTAIELRQGGVHEQGHALDIAFGLPSINSTTFSLALANDFGLHPCGGCINAKTESQAFPNGIPTPYKWDPDNGWVSYTPPAASPQPNIRNETILKDLYPQYLGNWPNTTTARGELWASLWQQYRNQHVNYQWDNPYAGNNHWPGGYPNGTKTLSFVEFFKLFRMTLPGANGYFDKLYRDSTFIP